MVTAYGETPEALRDIAVFEMGMSLVAEESSETLSWLKRALGRIDRITERGWDSPQNREDRAWIVARQEELRDTPEE